MTDQAAQGPFLDRVRAFVADELLDRPGHFDGLPEAPPPEWARLHEAGLANWWVPAEFGGPGLPLEQGVDVVAELAYGDGGFALGTIPSIIGSTMLRLAGPGELAREHLTALARDGGFSAVAAAEEHAGSELVRTETAFTRDGDTLRLTGEKFFSTNADAASLLFVLARSADDDGLRVVAVPRETPGLEIVKRWDMVGVRGSATYRLRFRDCAVPAANLLRGNGVRNLEIGLNASRILIAATAVGMADRVRDIAMGYAAVRQVKGAPLADNAVFAAKLGQIEMLIDVMRNQCRAAAREFDAAMAEAGRRTALQRTGTLRSALAAKMFCGQAGWQVATIGSEMFGGLGYTNDHPIGKLVRDLRYVGLVEGGDDVIRDLLYTRYVAPARRRG